jgi:glycosyltransferase involved in cell wall biosynthesis
LNRYTVPRISIITINLNNRDGLERTVKSVITQTFRDYEFIIIDGGSTDGSIDVIQEYIQSIHVWRSEKDSGIYNAMNKGIFLSEGEYILMLNSGDKFHSDNSLQIASKYTFNYDIIFGDILWRDKSDSYVTSYPDKLRFSFFLKQSIGHSSTFIRRELHSKIGLYNESFNIISDWCFFLLAICKYNVPYFHIPEVISECTRDGISCDPGNWERILIDRNNFIENEFPSFTEDYYELDQCIQSLNKFRSSNIFKVLKVIRKISKKLIWIPRD